MTNMAYIYAHACTKMCHIGIISYIFTHLKRLFAVCFIETVREEEELILDGIGPIWPVVLTWTRDEFVRNLRCKKLLVEVAVDLVEEIIHTAVKDDVERFRLDEMSHIDDGIVLPVLRMLLDCSETL